MKKEEEVVNKLQPKERKKGQGTNQTEVSLFFLERFPSSDMYVHIIGMYRVVHAQGISWMPFLACLRNQELLRQAISKLPRPFLTAFYHIDKDSHS
jgi:hypothetical protein